MSIDTEHTLRASLHRIMHTFLHTLPVIVGMLLLTSLGLTVFPPEEAAHYFGANDFVDMLLGAALGSVAAGPPLASYVLGGELLTGGVSLLAVTALIVSWVTVGVLQLPVEALMFGHRFAIMRNLVSFVFALAIAWLTVQTLGWLGAGV